MATTRKLAFDEIKIDITFPRGIETIHFNRNGDVLRVTFSDGALTLDYPSVAFSEQPLNDVDLVGMYHLPAHYVLFRNRSNNRYIYGFHAGSCINVGQETDEMQGEMIMRIGGEGVVSVRYPDGQESDSMNNPFSDLKEGPLENVDMLALRSYALLEYRDRKTQETRFRVVQSGQGGLGYEAAAQQGE
jgi:hypothetical protein